MLWEECFFEGEMNPLEDDKQVRKLTSESNVIILPKLDDESDGDDSDN